MTPALEHRAVVDTECPKAAHPTISRGQRFELRCPVCSEERGHDVYHQWRVTGGYVLPDREVRPLLRPQRKRG